MFKIDPKNTVYGQAATNQQLWLAQSVRNKENMPSLQFSPLNMLIPAESKKLHDKC